MNIFGALGQDSEWVLLTNYTKYLDSENNLLWMTTKGVYWISMGIQKKLVYGLIAVDFLSHLLVLNLFVKS